MKSVRHPFVLLLLILFSSFTATAQNNSRKALNKCGTMPHLQQLLEKNQAQKIRFENQRKAFTQMLSQRRILQEPPLRMNATVHIPVVFHIVLTNPAQVSDAQIQAQLDTLNKDFFGSNGDSVKIPSYFKPLFGRSKIQFCLAQRTPDGEPTNGIVRTPTPRTSFDVDDGVKRTVSGGVESWNPGAYLNVWICALSDGILGYASLPDDGLPNEQGVVVDYRSLPGGSFSTYNAGKTLTHETGHYFNLYHIWGDDEGLCTGSDFVDDTPNQADASLGNFTGVKTDDCSPAGSGIMYQNFMDYSDDEALVMFTAQQVIRMESALSVYRSSLLSSNGCQPVVRKAFDAQLKAIYSPAQRSCTGTLAPVVILRNNGSQTLTAATISAQIDNGPVVTTAWTGTLPTAVSTTVNVTNLTTTEGTHTLTVFVSNPNATNDEEKSNDTLRQEYQYYAPVTNLSEGFEGNGFPPVAWDIVNPDKDIRWKRVTGIAKTGNASVMISNADYSAIGQEDELRLPQINLPANLDSAFLSFQVAAATYTPVNTLGNFWDTLQVLVSIDCGQTYTSVYKKWGSSLITHMAPEYDAFVPIASEWRKDSVNLSAFIGKDNLLIAFRNTTGNENNIYLDDVNLQTIAVNPNLKASGFLVTPNPTSGKITVQFYPQPADLKGIQVFNNLGQKLAEIKPGDGQASNQYTFDLSRYTPGIYLVRAVFADKVVVKKILKM